MQTIKGAELKRFTVRLPEDSYALLVQDARRLGISPGVLARAYLKMVLDRRTDIVRIVEDLGQQPTLDQEILSELQSK